MNHPFFLPALCILLGCNAVVAQAPKSTPAPVPTPPPTFADVAYGTNPRQVIDFWKALWRGAPAAPAIYIHGGAAGGDKKMAAATGAKQPR
ncbi:MAG: hypothetical protein R3F31_09020 [Verrucomicrobiales bacterium]